MSEEINIVAQFTANPGSEGDLEQAMRAVASSTLEEEGCLRFELVKGRDDGRVLAFIERFKDQAAFDHHAQAAYVKEFLDNGVPSLVESQAVVFYTQIG